ncbi:MAG TPA: hypothetical protein VHN11_07780 [Xanthobacteraceae bacterium]|jgi:hypothetical protein|nr:hypothetical protein [Xanthobacteraceae bacterium]
MACDGINAGAPAHQLCQAHGRDGVVLPTGAATSAEPEPPYKELISENIRTLFSQTTAIDSVSVSPVQRAEFNEGPGWRTCLKASMRSPSDRYNGLKTYMITIQRSKIVDARHAEAEDACDQETFEKLAIAANEAGR